VARAVRWTDEKVKALKLPSGKAEQRTLVAPGLYMYVRGRAGGGLSKQWQYRVQLDGKRRWLSLGGYPEVGLAQAERERMRHETVRQAARKGEAEHPAIAARKERTTLKANPLVKDAFVDWLARKALSSPRLGGKPVKPRTLALHRESFEDVLPEIGEYQVGRLTGADLQRCIDRPLNRGSPGAARLVYKALRDFISYCMKKQYIHDTAPDPMRNIDNPSPYRPQRPNAANDDEIIFLLRAVDSSGMDDSTKRIIEFGLLTGLRPGEARHLRWDQVRLDESLVLLSAEDVKTNEPFRLHLSPQCVRLLQSAKRGAGTGPYVFPGRIKDHPLSKTAVNTALRRKFQDTGLAGNGKKVKPHDLRKTFRTLLARMKVDPEVAGLCLNHSEEEVLRKIYDGYDYRPEMANAWNKAGGHVQKLRQQIRKTPVVPTA
jgi:integrase